jgi:hypothetical protein
MRLFFLPNSARRNWFILSPDKFSLNTFTGKSVDKAPSFMLKALFYILN